MTDNDNDNDNDIYYTAREKTIVIIPKITGFLSMVSSSWMIYHIATNKTKRKLSYHRLVLVLSVFDIITSFGYFLSSWPLPQGNNYGAAMELEDPESPGGGEVSPLCKLQAFCIHWGITTAATNVILSIHYLLVIRYNYTERQLKSKVEPYYLMALVVFGLALTIPAFVLNIYGYNPNSRNIWCNIFVPCDGEGSDEEECIQYSMILRWALYFGPLWVCLICASLLMIPLYLSVRSKEAASRRWDINTTTTGRQQTTLRRLKQSRRVAVQASLYVFVFIVVWLPILVLDMLTMIQHRWFVPNETNGFIALFAVMFFQPLQGVFNLLVYRRWAIRAVNAVSKHLSRASLSLSGAISVSKDSTSGGQQRATSRISSTQQGQESQQMMIMEIYGEQEEPQQQQQTPSSVDDDPCEYDDAKEEDDDDEEEDLEKDDDLHNTKQSSEVGQEEEEEELQIMTATTTKISTTTIK